jgi:hypothetical protein
MTATYSFAAPLEITPENRSLSDLKLVDEAVNSERDVFGGRGCRRRGEGGDGQGRGCEQPRSHDLNVCVAPAE